MSVPKGPKMSQETRLALTAREQRFIDEYVLCPNGAKAARRAGYSARTARQIATENLTKPYIRAEINRRLEAAHASANAALAFLSEQMRGDIGDFLDISGTYTALNLSKGQSPTRLVRKWRQTKQGQSIELYDAQAAAVHILKVAGRYKEGGNGPSRVPSALSGRVIVLPPR